MRSLSPAERRELRAKAHHLHPVVAIGRQGLTDPVLHEIDVALTAHELIKVRVADDDRDERERLATRICDVLGCAPVQHLGKLLILWRPRPVDQTPGAPARRAGNAKSAAATAPPRPRAARKPRETAPARLRAPRAMAPAGTPKAGEARRRRRTGHAAPPTAAPRAPSARRRRRQG
jgi:putative YhbY family RNA-binding protein